MKSNLSQDLALKLASNENYFTEELLGILWIDSSCLFQTEGDLTPIFHW